MDLESDDRQSRSGSVCCNGCESVCGRIDELPSGDHFPDRMLFGICHGNFLIPIVVAIFAETNETLMIISISACMAGAVCGDHCSPISDTTIMASAGAQCDHVTHVSTQLPYVITAALVSFVTYIIAGFVQSAWIALPVGIGLMIVTLMVIKKKTENQE